MKRKIDVFTKAYSWFAVRTLAISLVLLLAQAPAANAGLLGLVQQPPDIATINLSVSYSAASDIFSAIGKADVLDLDGAPPPDFGILNDNSPPPFAVYDLKFLVDASGNFSGGVAGDDLSIDGAVDLNNNGIIDGSEVFTTLLTAEVDAFGFQDPPGGEIFEVTAAVTGGSLASLFGNEVGIIIDAQDSGFDGLFNIDFANSFAAGRSDTFATGVVPEPGSFAVFVVVGAVFLGFTRKRWSPRFKTWFRSKLSRPTQ